MDTGQGLFPADRCPEKSAGLPLRPLEGWENNMMNHWKDRLLSGVCAVVLLVTAAVPAAYAQEPANTETVQALSASDVKEMQQADAIVTALTDSTEFAEMSVEQRTDAAQTRLVSSS